MELNKTYIIQHKETKELFRARSGKTSWKAPGHAKNAFHNSLGHDIYCRQYGLEVIEYEDQRWGEVRTRSPRFDEQDVYEIVELKLNDSTQLDKAATLLTECLGRCDYQMQKRIEEFLEELQ